jgi:predicted O-linked N-acetylglucosamine transferase (SPINDLY family)
MPQLTIPDAFALAMRQHQAGAFAESAKLYQQIVAAAPDYVEAHYNLGISLKAMGRLEEAVAAYRRAVSLRPAFADAWVNLGNTLKQTGSPHDAIAAYRSAIAARPDYAQAHHNLAVVLHELGQIEDAIRTFHKALEIAPNLVEAHQNLGNALRDAGKVDEAIASHQRAGQVLPESSEVQVGLGNALRDAGRAEDAIEVYRRALELAEAQKSPPKAVWTIAGNLLFTLNFVPGYDRRRIYSEHVRLAEKFFSSEQVSSATHANDRTPDRRLRIGYVSPDFSQHPVGRFMLPLLANHDPQRFEVFCYSDVRRPDHITEQLRARANAWRETGTLADPQLEQLIRSDRIDILLDLAMHTRDNRLLVFARKPAPVQVSYLAYCGTTALKAIDYRFTDPYLDPPDGDDSVYSEKSIRLPNCFWCFLPGSEEPRVGPLPALTEGRITFGSFNNFCKVNSATLAAWIELLKRVPDSRLVLFAEPGEHRGRAWELFSRNGLDPQRLWFSGFLPARQYLEQYQHVDIALDPFPYPGGTTTFDALWMGVPVVSLAGETAVSRAGLSILSNVGLPQLVATTTEQCISIASQLATDLPRLAELRASLRSMMKRSPVMDAPRFAGHVEEAFAQMWRNWCACESPAA